MSDVVLGPIGSKVLVDLDVCAKTGRTTDQRVTLRGSTWPGWVLLLLVVTVIGFLVARAVTSRRYAVTLPLTHAAFVRWKRHEVLAWVAGLVGVGAVLAAASTGGNASVLWGLLGVVLVVAALVGGTVNTAVHGLRLRADAGNLVLVGSHPDFARAVAAAAVEPVRS